MDTTKFLLVCSILTGLIISIIYVILGTELLINKSNTNKPIDTRPQGYGPHGFIFDWEQQDVWDGKQMIYADGTIINKTYHGGLPTVASVGSAGTPGVFTEDKDNKTYPILSNEIGRTIHVPAEQHIWYNLETNQLFSMRFGKEVESVVADIYVYIGEL